VNREHVASGLLALLAALAIGGVAAALDARRGGTGAGSGGGSGVGIGENTRFSLGGGISVDATRVTLPDWLVAVVAVVVLLVAVYGLYELYREYGRRRLAGAAAAGVALTALLYGLVLALRAVDGDPGPGLPREGRPSLQSGGAGGTAEQVTRAVDPPTALLVALGVVLLGAVAVIVRATGDRPVGIDAVPAGDDAPGDVAAVADAAGRAADRIDGDADLDNAVYRAWREMTADLPVDDPASSTPGEFADAAVAAGMARDDVAELTDLFEAVRYGDHTVTDARADRATAALRRIEATYGDGDGDERSGPTAARDAPPGPDAAGGEDA
jgi:hypothetical protein